MMIYVMYFSQENGAMSKERLPLIGSSGNRSAGMVNTLPSNFYRLYGINTAIDMGEY